MKCGVGHTATNKMFLQWRGSVSSLLSFSLFTLCRGTGRNWSALAFRVAPLLRPPMPATAETQTLCAIFFMKDWYRRKTWTKADEEEFFAKLGRARKDGRAEYLKIQAIELVETKDKQLLKVAESLLNKMLDEFPEDNFNKSSAFHTLGDIYKINDNLEKAIDYYKKAIDFETVYPNVRTNSYLDFSELIIKTKKADQYDFVESILLKELPGQIFPVLKYKTYSILSVISDQRDNRQQAKHFAELADKNANEETSGLRYHKYLGVVKDRDNWLDNLIKSR